MTLWPLGVYCALAIALVAVTLGLSCLLGQRHRDRTTGEPYESGIPPTGSAWMRFDVKYYLVAMFFVIFDLEAVFIFAWAVSLRESGWAGFIEASIFILILVAALAYIWSMGALDWGRQGRPRTRRETGPIGIAD
ncbi:MAG TPA: NADH-quinone oxidoreductase subunit A [Syntrophorhabdales bacterium]|nr:NADH-quinone oxidoreductase subunit A [Syntrophorhabdales bacterium]